MCCCCHCYYYQLLLVFFFLAFWDELYGSTLTIFTLRRVIFFFFSFCLLSTHKTTWLDFLSIHQNIQAFVAMKHWFYFYFSFCFFFYAVCSHFHSIPFIAFFGSRAFHSCTHHFSFRFSSFFFISFSVIIQEKKKEHDAMYKL